MCDDSGDEWREVGEQSAVDAVEGGYDLDKGVYNGRGEEVVEEGEGVCFWCQLGDFGGRMAKGWGGNILCTTSIVATCVNALEG